MSFQRIANKESESPSISPGKSQANPKIRARLQSLPVEILVRISELSMKEEEEGTNPGNITRNLPNFITSLKCGVNDPWRRGYIYTLNALSRNWVYSLHFGNKWNLQMDSEEGGLVRNIVIKYLPEIWPHQSSYYSPFRSTQTINGASEVNSSTEQLTVFRGLESYCWNPMPDIVNSSLDNLPNVCSIQLEFKTFCVSLEAKGIGMCKALQRFLDDHKEFKLKSATIEPTSRALMPLVQRIVIPQVTLIAGHDVCFDLTDKGIWELKAFAEKADARVETVDLDLEDDQDSILYRHFDDIFQVLRRCKWTWVFGREEKCFSSLETKDRSED
ncbi:hypothetical protein BELL_0820g00030 [Botrytis elliptica]|uniref:Uncharacterized protein n=1 Tax=Botrytis elliptica TaxID=278938 RepID=A0A4Z1JAU9_9HELO|nr:hypothetical protein EAE99_007304 [Botrytis elliptica]TGO68592.1 hypothetical protein BELL_0820g00030 [Botrytis elliptica]